jgi:signal transduction histidine kinase
VAQPSPPWSRYRRPGLILVAVVLVGLVAEWLTWDFRGTSWLPHLAVGVGLGAIGATMDFVERRSWLGAIVALAAILWFAPSIVGSARIAALETVELWLTFTHRAALFHAILAFPSGRLVGWLEVGMAGLVYLSTTLYDVWLDERWTIAWAAGTVLGFLVVFGRRQGGRREAATRALPALVILALTVAGTAVLLLAFGNPPSSPFVLDGYGAGLVGVGLALLVPLRNERPRPADLADAMVELTQGPAEYVRALLAAALRDPSVEVAFAVDGEGMSGWVDELGRPIAPLRETASRVLVPILVDGRPVAEFAGEAASLADGDLTASIEAAAVLAARNAQLRAELRAEARALEASRLRLLTVGDEQRLALSGELERGAEQSLAELRSLLERVDVAADPGVREAVERGRDRLDSLDASLRSLSAGLGPPLLRTSGLASALNELAETAMVSVEVELRGRQLSSTLSTGVYFMCAEAVSNALKHAAGSTISVAVHVRGDRLVGEVSDDGRGGARVGSGSGLLGLSDRAAALGGTLSVVSPTGGGTRVAFDLPLG